MFRPDYSPSQQPNTLPVAHQQQEQQPLPQPKPSRHRERLSRRILLPSSVACEEGDCEGGRGRAYIAEPESEGPSHITPGDPTSLNIAAGHGIEMLTNAVMLPREGEGAQ